MIQSKGRRIKDCKQEDKGGNLGKKCSTFLKFTITLLEKKH